MVKQILLGLVILCCGLFIYITLQPDSFWVQRSASMAAPPATVFAQVNDLAAWDAWTPWKDLSANPKTTLSQPSAGAGAFLAWAESKEIGEGSLTILDSRRDERIVIEQDFVKPSVSTARFAFDFVPEGDGTRVTWLTDGSYDFFDKTRRLLVDPEIAMGESAEQGLANLKHVVERKNPDPVASAVAP